MASSSIPAVLDYIVATFRGLTVVVGSVTFAPAVNPLTVFDGMPGPGLPDPVYVAVGGTVVPTIGGGQVWASLGAQKRTEDYMVEVTITGWVGGSSDQQVADASDAQKTARDSVFAVFNAFDTAVRGTLTKATLAQHVNIEAEISSFQLDQTSPDDSDSGLGRYAALTFAVRAVNRI